MAANPSNPSVLTPDQLTLLTQANQLVSQGKHFEGAQVFAMLAVELESSQHPLQAANLHALAALTYIDASAGTVEIHLAAEIAVQALSQARLALNLFINQKMNDRTRRFYSTVIRKLQSEDMKLAIMALKSEFGRYGTSPLSLMPYAIYPTRNLPLACSYCAAPIHGDEIVWLDGQKAVCAYCGGLIHLSDETVS